MSDPINLEEKRAARDERRRFLIDNGYLDGPAKPDPNDLPRAMVGQVADVIALKRQSKSVARESQS